ncbi:MAG: class I SAM-dependent methyltransferase, partial [Nesterenkonia sp.]
YVYLAESIRAWPDQNELAAMIAGLGWEQVRYRNLSGGIVAIHHARKPQARRSAGTRNAEATPEGSAERTG